MNNRINTLFEKQYKNILSVYFTAGYPGLNDTVEIIRELENAGAGIVEIGMPFSDPTADGQVIQQSSHQALINGMSLELLFNQLENIRGEVSIPLVLMGYVNPVCQFGVERFCQKCNETGIDGVIIPDLPLYEYESSFKPFFEDANLHNILLITPQTSNKRIIEIDNKSTGFIYMVSSSSTTGKKQNIEDFHQGYFDRVNSLGLKTPRLIGFGISNKDTFQNACKNAQGAIIGTAFIQSFETNVPIIESIHRFVKTIKG